MFYIVTPIAQADYTGPPSVLIAIAQCESGQHQYRTDGSLTRDSVTGTHIGLYQISTSYKKDALSKGYDITTPEGNTAYAIYMYQKYGTSPWLASQSCWSKKIAESDV